jgi:hypothetical protein
VGSFYKAVTQIRNCILYSGALLRKVICLLCSGTNSWEEKKVCMSIPIVGIAPLVLGGTPLLTYWPPNFWFLFGYLASILDEHS